MPIALVGGGKVGDRLAALRQFYDLMDRLEAGCGGKKRLSDCHGRLGWPERGVYFFFEDGESRSDSGMGPRVVRVGTHALADKSRTRLWTRLAQHRGNSKLPGGNHRGSIFRLIVGRSLIARDGHASPTWGEGANAPPAVRESEEGLEAIVSGVIGAMPFLWLEVSDEAGSNSDRGLIERNAISLLSNAGKAAIDSPSTQWLGRHCDRPRVRASGLWNSNHIDGQWDSAFLKRVERRIEEMEERT